MPHSDPEALKAWHRAYYERKREEIKAKVTARYWADPEKGRAAIAESKRRHPESRAIQRQREKEAKWARGKCRPRHEVVLHAAHVAAWKAHTKAMREAALIGPPWPPYRLMTDADAYRWRYANEPEFVLKERLRRQLKKKAESVPGMAEVIRYGLMHGGDMASTSIERLLGYSITELRAHIERQFSKGMTWAGYGKHGWHIDHILPRKCFAVETIDGLRAYWALTNLRPLGARKNLAKRDKVEFLC